MFQRILRGHKIGPNQFELHTDEKWTTILVAREVELRFGYENLRMSERVSFASDDEPTRKLEAIISLEHLRLFTYEREENDLLDFGQALEGGALCIDEGDRNDLLLKVSDFPQIVGTLHPTYFAEFTSRIQEARASLQGSIGLKGTFFVEASYPTGRPPLPSVDKELALVVQSLHANPVEVVDVVFTSPL